MTDKFMTDKDKIQKILRNRLKAVGHIVDDFLTGKHYITYIVTGDLVGDIETLLKEREKKAVTGFVEYLLEELQKGKGGEIEFGTLVKIIGNQYYKVII